jgi:hypothetical protein
MPQDVLAFPQGVLHEDVSNSILSNLNMPMGRPEITKVGCATLRFCYFYGARDTLEHVGVSHEDVFHPDI